MTDLPYGSLAPAEYLVHLRRDIDDLTSALREGPLDAQIPACPDWTVRDLAAHLGGVHEYVCKVIATGPGRRQHGTISGDVADWYAARADTMLRLLADLDPDQQCWTHQQGNERVAYWCRRQAHEVAMHRADARFAVGEKPVYDADLAVDGIGEMLDLWMPRLSAQGHPPTLTATLRLRRIDGPNSWLLIPDPTGPPQTMGPTHAEPATAEISGTASELLFRLWNRPADVLIGGDRDVAEPFLAHWISP